MATLQVELVAVERTIWSGEARLVIARTTEGELGILPGHAPLLGQLAEGGVVTIRGAEGQEDLVVAAHGGFVSVTERGVSILAETLQAFKAITEGEYDAVPEQAFFMCGGLEDLERNADKLKKG